MSVLTQIQAKLNVPKNLKNNFGGGIKFKNNTPELFEYVKKHFKYNSDGTLTRTDRKNSNGSIDKYGYLIIKVKTAQMKAHRIVWLLHNGSLPTYPITLDHINGNKLDNRIENLRLSNQKMQTLNIKRKPNKDTGEVGIHLTKMKGLKAIYTYREGGKTRRFRTLEEAVKARKEYIDECFSRDTK